MAHLSFFHDEFVKRRRWVHEAAYADIVALCQFLPGPASSQVGIALGLTRAGPAGALAAWLGFTLPSALFLTLAALGAARFGIHEAWLQGLKIAAVAVVAQAVGVMGQKLCPDFARALIAAAGAGLILWMPQASSQLLVIGLGALAGALFLRKAPLLPHRPGPALLPRWLGIASLLLFFALLSGLPLLAANGAQGAKLFAIFYRAGSLVFGGGHVVLPLLQAEVVPRGWVSNELFLAGYGLAQAMPGPLFTFSAFLGAASSLPPNGWAGAALCLAAAFLPSFLLVFGCFPFWEDLRKFSSVRQAMLGINAAVVGLLLAALYHPVITSAIHSLPDAMLAGAGLALLIFARLPSWALVILCAVTGRFFL